MNQKYKTVVITIIGLLIITLLCFLSVGMLILAGVIPFSLHTVQESNKVDESIDYDYTQDYPETSDDVSTTEEKHDEGEVESIEAPITGTITGSVSYPSEFIPEGMTICAEPETGTEPYCTSELIEQPSTLPTYELEVPVGNYYIYAYDANGDPDYTAYYSEFVTCGLSVGCDSHKPILITIEAGEIVEDIDPGDWYNF